MKRNLVDTSKFLSFILRHKPEAIDLSLDQNGWAAMDELLAAAADHGKKIDLPLLREVVEKNDKQRFVISEDGQYIRASPALYPYLFRGMAINNVTCCFDNTTKFEIDGCEVLYTFLTY